MSKTELIRVNRNTAVALSGVVTAPAARMIDETVPDCAVLFGFDPAKPEYEPWVFAADDSATREPDQHRTEPFYLVSWAAKKVMIAQPDGAAPTAGVRVTLIDPDGETLAFVSMGVALSLDTIRTLRGDGPYEPPIPITVTETKTRMGRRLWKLRIAIGVAKPPKKSA